MYQFSPVSERITKMREKIRDRVIQTDSERAMIVTEAFKDIENLVPTIRRPTLLKAVTAKATLRVEDEDVLVGNRGRFFSSSPQYPEMDAGGDWIMGSIRNGDWKMGADGLYHNPESEDLRLSIAQEDLDNLESIKDYWKGKSFVYCGDGWAPDGIDELKRLGATKHNVFMKHLVGCHPGHLIAGFDKIINTGYAAIRKQAQDWLDDHFGNIMGDDVKRCLFYSAVVIVCDAAITFVRRYGVNILERTAESAAILAPLPNPAVVTSSKELNDFDAVLLFE